MARVGRTDSDGERRGLRRPSATRRARAAGRHRARARVRGGARRPAPRRSRPPGGRGRLEEGRRRLDARTVAAPRISSTLSSHESSRRCGPTTGRCGDGPRRRRRSATASGRSICWEPVSPDASFGRGGGRTNTFFAGASWPAAFSCRNRRRAAAPADIRGLAERPAVRPRRPYRVGGTGHGLGDEAPHHSSAPMASRAAPTSEKPMSQSSHCSRGAVSFT